MNPDFVSAYFTHITMYFMHYRILKVRIQICDEKIECFINEAYLYTLL